MGASSAGLGSGTTVYFELPLFSAATAGKLPLAPLITDYPPQSEETFENTSPVKSSARDRARLLDEVVSTPGTTKPRPPMTPLTGSAIHIVDATTDECDTSPSPRLRYKPMQGMPS